MESEPSFYKNSDSIRKRWQERVVTLNQVPTAFAYEVTYFDQGSLGLILKSVHLLVSGVKREIGCCVVESKFFPLIHAGDILLRINDQSLIGTLFEPFNFETVVKLISELSSPRTIRFLRPPIAGTSIQNCFSAWLPSLAELQLHAEGSGGNHTVLARFSSSSLPTTNTSSPSPSPQISQTYLDPHTPQWVRRQLTPPSLLSSQVNWEYTPLPNSSPLLAPHPSPPSALLPSPLFPHSTPPFFNTFLVSPSSSSSSSSPSSSDDSTSPPLSSSSSVGVRVEEGRGEEETKGEGGREDGMGRGRRGRGRRGRGRDVGGSVYRVGSKWLVILNKPHPYPYPCSSSLRNKEELEGEKEREEEERGGGGGRGGGEGFQVCVGRFDLEEEAREALKQAVEEVERTGLSLAKKKKRVSAPTPSPSPMPPSPSPSLLSYSSHPSPLSQGGVYSSPYPSLPQTAYNRPYPYSPSPQYFPSASSSVPPSLPSSLSFNPNSLPRSVGLPSSPSPSSPFPLSSLPPPQRPSPSPTLPSK